MKAIDILEVSTLENFEEQAYLLFNKDVQTAIDRGHINSAKDHFITNGKEEGRLQLRLDLFEEFKKQKLARIRDLLVEQDEKQFLSGISGILDTCFYDFLDENTKQNFNIVDTDLVSEKGYDATALKLIEHYSSGNILDLGAGFRRLNYSNVVNYEIVEYLSTDVLGVGEKLPFKDSSFDCIFSFAVLEHVKDPFVCAQEIARCLKPGGVLYTVVPHLQPYHGYPHHYYNMTHQGLANLFPSLKILHQEVNYGGSVIWSISWILQRWSDSLPANLKEQLLELKVADLIAPTLDFLEEYGELVNSIPADVQIEIAATTSLIATKKPQEDFAPQQAEECVCAIEAIRPSLQSNYINETQLYSINEAQSDLKIKTNESIKESLEPEALPLDSPANQKKQISFTQKIEHILRTTLHYFRIWKRDLFDFK